MGAARVPGSGVRLSPEQTREVLALVGPAEGWTNRTILEARQAFAKRHGGRLLHPDIIKRITGFRLAERAPNEALSPVQVKWIRDHAGPPPWNFPTRVEIRRRFALEFDRDPCDGSIKGALGIRQTKNPKLTDRLLPSPSEMAVLIGTRRYNV